MFQVALLDTSTSSVLFVTDSLSGSSSPVNSLAVKLFSDSSELINNQEDTESKTMGDHLRLEVFAMTKDAHLVVIDGNTGGIISSQSIKSEKEVISPSMYILGKYLLQLGRG